MTIIEKAQWCISAAVFCFLAFHAAPTAATSYAETLCGRVGIFTSSNSVSGKSNEYQGLGSLPPVVPKFTFSVDCDSATKQITSCKMDGKAKVVKLEAADQDGKTSDTFSIIDKVPKNHVTYKCSFDCYRTDKPAIECPTKQTKLPSTASENLLYTA